MGIVDHHQRLARAADPLHAPARRLDLPQYLARLRQRHAVDAQHGQAGQQVGGIETAKEGRLDAAMAPRGGQFHCQPFKAGVHCHRPHVATFQPVGDHLSGHAAACQLAAEQIIHIDDGMAQPLPVEQPFLGGAVGSHRTVIVQMVAGQIGEYGGAERHAIDTELVQPVAGHFHGDHMRALAAEIRQCALHRHRVRRGVGSVGQGAEKAVADRTDQCRLLPQQGEGLRQPGGDRGLAVGAGDTDHRQRLAGLAQQKGRHHAGAGTQVRHRQVGHGPAGLPFKAVGRIPRYRHRPAGNGVGNIVATIGIFATEGQEQVTRQHAAAVGRDPVRPRAQCIQCGSIPGRQGSQSGNHVSSFTTGMSAGRRVLWVGASGSMPSTRRLPAITRLNTGAAEMPP